MAEERVKEKEIEEEDQKVLDRLKKIYSETILRKTLFLSIKGDDNSHYT